MQFYFIRHAQSLNNALWDNGNMEERSEDPGLTDTGKQQADLLANFLQRGHPAGGNGSGLEGEGGFGITHLYCSLMVRAASTGTAVSNVLELPLVAWKDFHEWGGIYNKDSETREYIGNPGNPRSYFETHFPELVLPEDLGEEGWWNRPFEAREERPTRAARVMQELLDRHADTEDRVVVISHGGFFKHFLSLFLQVPYVEGYWIWMHNTAITRIDITPENNDLIYVNRTSHLPVSLLT
jgi:2,3-bisphosphoglycerate-dependent phosphoglycerate mutase